MRSDPTRWAAGGPGWHWMLRLMARQGAAIASLTRRPVIPTQSSRAQVRINHSEQSGNRYSGGFIIMNHYEVVKRQNRTGLPGTDKTISVEL